MSGLGPTWPAHSHVMAHLPRWVDDEKVDSQTMLSAFLGYVGVCNHKVLILPPSHISQRPYWAPRNHFMQFFSNAQSIRKAFHRRVLPTAQSQTDQARARRPVRLRASPLFSSPPGWAIGRRIIANCPMGYFSRYIFFGDFNEKPTTGRQKELGVLHVSPRGVR